VRDELEQLRQALHDARIENSGQAAELERLNEARRYHRVFKLEDALRRIRDCDFEYTGNWEEGMRAIAREALKGGGGVSAPVLAPDHTGMYVSASGLLSRQNKEKGLNFMRSEMLKHLELMAREYYAGNVQIVDRFLQLYRLGENKRKAAKERIVLAEKEVAE